jgi:hypothetical protein
MLSACVLSSSGGEQWRRAVEESSSSSNTAVKEGDHDMSGMFSQVTQRTASPASGAQFAIRYQGDVFALGLGLV